MHKNVRQSIADRLPSLLQPGLYGILLETVSDTLGWKMSEEKYFEKALSDMKDSFAGKDGIKHLAELGYSVRQIQASLDFPFPLDKIGRVLWDHYRSEEIILQKAPGSGAGSVKVHYIKQTDAYGKQSFIKVQGDDKAESLSYKKVIYHDGHDIFSPVDRNEKRKVKMFLEENSTCGPDYVSFDFGRLKTRNGAEWRSLLSSLSADDRDYLEVMPWESSLTGVYHLIDDRVIRILEALEGTGYLPGVFYFAVKDV